MGRLAQGAAPQARVQRKRRTKSARHGVYGGVDAQQGTHLWEVGPLRAAGVKIDAVVNQGHDFAHEAVSHPPGQRPARKPRKGAVHVLAIGHVAAEIQEPVNIENGNGDDAAPQRHQQFTPHQPPNGFDAVHFIAVHAAHQQQRGTGRCGAQHVHRHVNHRARWQLRNHQPR